MKDKRRYDDDDGRSIADMSDVSRPNLLNFRRDPSRKKSNGENDGAKVPENPAASMPKQDRRAFIWGALSAALLIALIFMAGIGLVIFLITLLA